MQENMPEAKQIVNKDGQIVMMDEQYCYTPVVGDSVTYDTPILIKYNGSHTIDIKPICELFNENKAVEYRDFSKKDFKVLTNTGWTEVEYVYRHNTNKQLKRVTTKDGLVDCTEDHSLFTPQMEEIKPSQLKRGDGIAVYRKRVDYKQRSEITTNIAWLYGFFMADGNAQISEQKQTYFSKREQKMHTYPSVKKYWKISNKNTNRLEKAKSILEESGYKCQIKDHIKSSAVYNLTCYDGSLILKSILEFYTSYGYKKVPACILNSTTEIKKAFLDGFCCGDGQGDTMEECVEFGQKSKVAMAGLAFILQELGYNFRLHIRNDKPEFIAFRFRNHRGSLLNDDYSERSHYKIWDIRDVTSKSEYVYDISCDGTFVTPFGMITCHNTDGVNMLIASKLRYTDEHPYIATGEGRNGEKGKAYTGIRADIQEFEDMYLNPQIPGNFKRLGLDLDEVIPGNLLMRRKVYADLLEDGSLKRVGNAVKSKTMQAYVKHMILKGLNLLLYNKGKEFIEAYYDYVEKIYNYQIPLASIASVGKIKITLDEYKERCKELTAAGTKKSRQAWYELAIKNNLKVNLGDAIYYINTGKKKSDSDIQRVTKYYSQFAGTDVDVTKEYKREYEALKRSWKKDPENDSLKKYVKENKKFVSLSEYMKMLHPDIEERDELIFNCVLVPTELVDDEEDHYCEDEGIEYNSARYIEILNNRLLNLTVCFDRKMRERVDEKGKVVSNILIDNPKDRKFFTEEECELISGQPLNESDQDKLEDVLMPEDKEIRFWTSINEKPPYADECGLDWEAIKADYFERQAVLQQEGIKQEYEQYQKILSKMKDSEIDEFLENGTLPDGITKICSIRTKDGALVSKQYNTVYGFLTDIVDLADEFKPEDDDEDNGPDE